jgi:hypothetical protein
MFMQRRSQLDTSEKWAYFVSWCVVGGPSFLPRAARGLVLGEIANLQIAECSGRLSTLAETL